MSEGGRAQFAWPHPGQERELPPESWSPEPPADDSEALDAFCLVRGLPPLLHGWLRETYTVLAPLLGSFSQATRGELQEELQDIILSPFV